MKKLLFTSSIVLLLAAGCNPNQPVAEQNQSNNTQPTTITQTNTDETANWNAYNNSDFGFRIQYPPTVSLKEQNPTQGISFVLDFSGIGNLDKSSVQVFAWGTDVSTVEPSCSSHSGGPCKDVTVNGAKGQMLDSIESMGTGAGFVNREYSFAKGKNIYRFLSVLPANSFSQTQGKTYNIDAIVKTFQFVN